MKRKAIREAPEKAVTPPAVKPRKDVEQVIDHDDLCAICHCLLVRPVRTTCNHTVCSSAQMEALR